MCQCDWLMMLKRYREPGIQVFGVRAAADTLCLSLDRCCQYVVGNMQA